MTIFSPLEFPGSTRKVVTASTGCLSRICWGSRAAPVSQGRSNPERLAAPPPQAPEAAVSPCQQRAQGHSVEQQGWALGTRSVLNERQASATVCPEGAQRRYSQKSFPFQVCSFPTPAIFHHTPPAGASQRAPGDFQRGPTPWDGNLEPFNSPSDWVISVCFCGFPL